MNSALHDDDVRSAESSGDKPAGVPFHSGLWKIWNLFVRNNDRVHYLIGSSSEPRAEDNSKVWSKPAEFCADKLCCGCNVVEIAHEFYKSVAAILNRGTRLDSGQSYLSLIERFILRSAHMARRFVHWSRRLTTSEGGAASYPLSARRDRDCAMRRLHRIAPTLQQS